MSPLNLNNRVETLHRLSQTQRNMPVPLTEQEHTDLREAAYELDLLRHANPFGFDDYQQNVMKTWANGKTDRDRLLNAVMGIAGEAGELTDLIKKQEFHGVKADRDKVLKELGDVLYYVTACAIEHGFDLATVAAENNKKLAARYPKGFVLGGGIRKD